MKNKLSTQCLRSSTPPVHYMYEIKISIPAKCCHLSQYVDWGVIPNNLNKICLTATWKFWAPNPSARSQNISKQNSIDPLSKCLKMRNAFFFNLKRTQKTVKKISDFNFHMKTTIFYRKCEVLHTPACTRACIQY